MLPMRESVSNYKGYQIIVTDWGARFEYDGNPIRTSSLSSAMQVIDVLIDYDARHANDPVPVTPI